MLEPILAAAILLTVVVVLSRELASPPAVIVGGLVLFVITGIVPAETAFNGFSNPATISVAGLFVVARAIRDHAGLDRGLARLLGDGSTGPRRVLARMVPPIVGVSAITNNTPIVATGAPLVRSWAERHGIAASHLLMPLSFAAILGGVLTTIGTGPNLVVSGVVRDAGFEGLSFFEITPAALPLALIGAIILVLLAPAVLPDRRSTHERVAGHERDYTLRLKVVAGGPVDGASVADAQLRDLQTTYLASVVRNGQEIAPVAPDTLLSAEDELVFVGRIDQVRDLLDREGLVEAEAAQTELLAGQGHALVECVVSPNSMLVGHTLKEASFRGRYGGAVIAIHRAGERVAGKLGQVQLKAGDALLVLGDAEFEERWQGDSDFAVVAAQHDGTRSSNGYRRRVAIGSLVGLVALAASGLTSIVIAVLLACSVLVGSGTIGFRRALDALDRDVLLIVAAAIGLGSGIESSGLASLMADGIEWVTDGTGPVLALLMIVIGTMILTEMVTNVAAAALMVPIALEAAQRVDFDPIGFAVAVALAASSSFLTPIGYQTNTIVYGLGGYRFGDYWRLGLPLALSTVVVSVTVVPLVWG